MKKKKKLPGTLSKGDFVLIDDLAKKQIWFKWNWFNHGFIYI